MTNAVLTQQAAELASREKALQETLSDLKELNEELKEDQLQLVQAAKLAGLG